MKKIITTILLIISTQCFAQTYIIDNAEIEPDAVWSGKNGAPYYIYDGSEDVIDGSKLTRTYNEIGIGYRSAADFYKAMSWAGRLGGRGFRVQLPDVPVAQVAQRAPRLHE